VKVLLDECVDTRLVPHVTGFDTHTVHELGWAGVTNGKLLALAQEQFDVLVTVDRNLSFQQNLPKYSIAVVLLHARSNRIDDLVALVPEMLAAIRNALSGAVTHVGR